MPEVINPFKGLHKVAATYTEYWEVVTPHPTNYLKTLDNGDYLCAIALRVGDAGDLACVDHKGNTIVQTMNAGNILPGLFARVLAANTTCTKIYAAFMDL